MSRFKKEIAQILFSIYEENANNGLDAIDAYEMLGDFYDKHAGEIHKILSREEAE